MRSSRTDAAGGGTARVTVGSGKGLAIFEKHREGLRCLMSGTRERTAGDRPGARSHGPGRPQERVRVCSKNKATGSSMSILGN